MNKQYEVPDMELIVFGEQDVITMSIGTDPDNPNHETGWGSV